MYKQVPAANETTSRTGGVSYESVLFRRLCELFLHKPEDGVGNAVGYVRLVFFFFDVTKIFFFNFFKFLPVISFEVF